MKVLQCGNTDFVPFCSHDLNLDLTTFVYELDPYPLEIYWMCENELPMSMLSKVIVSQTFRHTVHTHATEIIHIPLCEWSIIFSKK